MFEYFDCGEGLPANWVFEESAPGAGSGWGVDNQTVGIDHTPRNCWARYYEGLDGAIDRTATVGSIPVDVSDYHDISIYFRFGYDDRLEAFNDMDFLQLWVFNPNTLDTLYWDSNNWVLNDYTTVWLMGADDGGELSFDIPQYFVEDNTGLQLFLKLDDGGGEAVDFAIDYFHVCGEPCDLSFDTNSSVAFTNPATCGGSATLDIDLDNNAIGTGPYDVLLNGTDTYPGFATEPISFNIPLGTYTSVKITDANGCTIVENGNWEVENPEPPLFAGGTNGVDFTSPADCNSNGQLYINVQNNNLGVPPYTIVLNGTNSFPNIDVEPFTLNIPDGVYSSVEIIDSRNCSSTRNGNWTISSPNAPTLNNLSVANPASCGNTGELSYDLSATSPPYVVEIDGVIYPNTEDGSTLTITGLPVGDYMSVPIVITDNLDCTSTINATFEITEPDGPSLTNLSVIDATSCGSTGGLSFNLGTTQGPYSVEIDGNPFPNTINNGVITITGIPVSNYSSAVILITDADDCTNSITRNFNVREPASPEFLNTNGVVFRDALTCNGMGELYIDLKNSFQGTAPYTVILDGNQIGPSQNTVPITIPISQGNYNNAIVEIVDANNCSDSRTNSWTVGEPEFSASISQGEPTCNEANGTAEVEITMGTGPYTYAWTGTPSTTETATGLAAGTYTVTVMDNDTNCSTDFSITLSNQGTPVSSVTPTTTAPTGCTDDGSATVTPADGTDVTYLWSDGQTTQTAINLGTGNYTVTITNTENGVPCSITETVSVPAGPGGIMETAAPVLATVSCNGGNDGSITGLSYTGGIPPYSYEWRKGNGTYIGNTLELTNLFAGNYNLTITDSGSCQFTLSNIVVSQPPALVANYSSTKVDCDNSPIGSIDLTVSGGTSSYSFLWSNGAMTEDLNNLTQGTYTVTITDANNCTKTLDAIVESESELVINLQEDAGVSCFEGSDGAATANVSGGNGVYTYLWDNGATTASTTGLDAGDHNVSITDDLGCLRISTINITQPDQIQTTSTTTNATCQGANNGQATLSTSGGTGSYTYAWPQGQNSSTVSDLDVDTYIVTITDANNCSATHSLTIEEDTPISLENNQVTDVNCNGESNGQITVIPANGSGTYTYDWSNGENQGNIDNLPAGTYSLTVADANSVCLAVQTFTVDEPTVLTLATNNPDNLCGETFASVTATAVGGNIGYQFEWSDGNTTATIDAEVNTAYMVTVTDAKGCVADEAFAILSLELPRVLGADSIDLCISSGETFSEDLDGYFDTDADYDWTIMEADISDFITLSNPDGTSGNTGNTLSQTLTLLQGGNIGRATYEVTAYLEDGTFRCEGEKLKLVVTVLPQATEGDIFLVPNIIIQGENWGIQVLDKTDPGNYQVSLHNRSGAKAYAGSLDWNGEGVQDGVYYYVIKNNNGDKLKSGAVLIQD